MPLDRWRSAWEFLSFEGIQSFWPELWLWIEEPSEFRRELEARLAPWLGRDEYHSHYELVHVGLVRWVLDQYGVDAFEYLCDWVRHIFIKGGPDGLAVSITHSIVYSTRDAVGLPDRVADALAKLRQELTAREQSLDERLSRVFAGELPAWDRRVREYRGTPPEWLKEFPDWLKETIGNDISLIGGHNALVEGWERHCAHLTREELDALYTATLGVQGEMRLDEWSYPDLWRYELSRLIRRWRAHQG